MGIRTIALLMFLCLPIVVFSQRVPNGVTYDAKILRVTDGDTVVIAATFLPQPLKPELAVRIFGVDTPEKGKRAQCESERIHGEAASAYTTHAVTQSGAKIQVTLYGWDKFGGRVLGDILINDQSLRSLLITNGFAREYYGDSKQSWCGK